MPEPQSSEPQSSEPQPSEPQPSEYRLSEHRLSEHELLVDGLAVGVCGMDREIAAAPARTGSSTCAATAATPSATYHHDGVPSATRAAEPDVVEATGVASVVFDALAATAPYGIVCLTGVSVAGNGWTA